MCVCTDSIDSIHISVIMQGKILMNNKLMKDILLLPTNK